MFYIQLLNHQERQMLTMRSLTNDLFAPVITLASTQDASTRVGNGVLRSYLRKMNRNNSEELIRFNLYNPGANKEEEYPMRLDDFRF